MIQFHLFLKLLGLILSIAISSPTIVFGQEDYEEEEEYYYFDKDWIQCGDDRAAYSRSFEEYDTLLKVTDRYIKGGLQCEAWVKNTPEVIAQLEKRGDYDTDIIGECIFYFKNGERDYSINYTPFDKNYGVNSVCMEMCDSLDTAGVDLTKLTFLAYYGKNYIDFGFMFEDDNRHGAWVSVSTETGLIASKFRYYLDELHGSSEEYYETGILKRKWNYTDDYLDGKQKKYDRKGNLRQLEVYKNGELIETWRYPRVK